MAIKDLTLDIIDAMDADQMRDTLKSEYARITIEEQERIKAEQEEQERKAKGQKIVADFFARKKANK